ncbi:hypothetical protein L3V83_11925 [Thiotrichales bacterium 19X7-9]|nr:hypothetical protein [Thiotrichales bacterium 19X7-9]
MTYKTINIYLDYYQEDEAYKIDNGIIKLNAYYIEKHGADASKPKLKEAVNELGGLEKYTHIRMMGHGSVEGDHIATNNQKGSFNTAHIRHMLSELIESNDNQYIIFELLSCNSASSDDSHSTLKQVIDPLHITNNTVLCTLGYKDVIIANDNMHSIYTEKLENTLCVKEQESLAQLEFQTNQVDKQSQLLEILSDESSSKRDQLIKKLENKSQILTTKIDKILHAIDILSHHEQYTDQDMKNIEIFENELATLEPELNEIDALLELAHNPIKLKAKIDSQDEEIIRLLDEQILLKETIQKQIGNRVSFFSDIHCIIKRSVTTIDNGITSKGCKSFVYQFPQNGIFNENNYQTLFDNLESKFLKNEVQTIQGFSLNPSQHFYHENSAKVNTTPQYDQNQIN